MIYLQKLTRLYNGMLLANLIMLVLIISLYPVPFSLLMDPVSWLGKIGNGFGSNYSHTFLLFSATMLFNIYLWRQILFLLAKTPIWKKPLIWFTGSLILIGFILMLFPCDRFDAVHSTGGGIVAGGLWILSTAMLYRSRKILNPCVYIGLQLILHASALFCAHSFAINSPLKGLGQRPVILALIVIPNICLLVQSNRQKKQGSRQDIPLLLEAK